MTAPRLTATAAALLLAAAVRAAEFTVVSCNVENLFDADGVARFEEYSPANYGPRQLRTKLDAITAVLARIGPAAGPDIVLLNEIEIDHTPSAAPAAPADLLKRLDGRTVAELLRAPAPEVLDLPAEILLLKRLAEAGLSGYTLVAGPDRPSAASDAHPIVHKNVVLSRFPVTAVRSHPVPEARAILEVLVSVDGHPLYVFCNHWKSGASDPATEPLRSGAARVLRARIDEILRADPHADLVLGGDFNCQHDQRRRHRATMPETAINDVLGSQGDELAIRGSGPGLYNLWYELPAAQRGSDIYRDEWGTLMQLILSRGLYDFRGVQYVDGSFAVGRFAGLNVDAAGRPLRWDGAGAGSGFSDHLPIFARFRTVPDPTPDRWLALTSPGTEEPSSIPNRVDFSAIDLPAVAVTAAQLPAGADLQDGSWNRRIFRVEGRVVGERPFRIEFCGKTFEVYAPERAVRDALWNAHRPGDAIRFYGELGMYKGRWQFVVSDRTWLK